MGVQQREPKAVLVGDLRVVQRGDQIAALYAGVVCRIPFGHAGDLDPRDDRGVVLAASIEIRDTDQGACTGCRDVLPGRGIADRVAVDRDDLGPELMLFIAAMLLSATVTTTGPSRTGATELSITEENRMAHMTARMMLVPGPTAYMLVRRLRSDFVDGLLVRLDERAKWDDQKTMTPRDLMSIFPTRVRIPCANSWHYDRDDQPIMPYQMGMIGLIPGMPRIISGPRCLGCRYLGHQCRFPRSAATS